MNYFNSNKIDLRHVVGFFRALADPTRCKILILLWDRTYCVCELTAALDLAQPTISRHLRILEQVGFVRSDRRGQRMDYSLALEDSEEIDTLLKMLKDWLEDSQEMEELRDKIRQIADVGPCMEKKALLTP